jgi:hypothetical protein
MTDDKKLNDGWYTLSSWKVSHDTGVRRELRQWRALGPWRDIESDAQNDAQSAEKLRSAEARIAELEKLSELQMKLIDCGEDEACSTSPGCLKHREEQRARDARIAELQTWRKGPPEEPGWYATRCPNLLAADHWDGVTWLNSHTAESTEHMPIRLDQP